MSRKAFLGKMGKKCLMNCKAFEHIFDILDKGPGDTLSMTANFGPFLTPLPSPKRSYF